MSVIATAELIVREQRIPPVRGLVTQHNMAGARLTDVDLKRWLRLNRLVDKADKCDVLAYLGCDANWPVLLEYADSLDMSLSLRTDCAAAPPDLAALADGGLLDVYLCPEDANGKNAVAWLEAAQAAGLPVRMLVTVPNVMALDGGRFCETFAAQGGTVLNVALVDPFGRRPGTSTHKDSEDAVAAMNALAEIAAESGIEANLIGLPFCHVSEANRIRAENSAQFYLDHQQYVRSAHERAVNLFERRSAMASKAILMLLAQHTLHRNRIDEVLLPFVMGRPWFYARAMAFEKLVRHLKPFKRTPDPTDLSMEAFEAAVRRARDLEVRELGPECAQCSLRRICDNVTPEFTDTLPGLTVKHFEGDVVLSPLHFCAVQPKYYDVIDRDRLAREGELDALAKEANAILNNRPPDETVSPYHYTVEEAPYDQMEGGTRWHSITNTEKLSSVITRLDPPFTVSIGFGGGIAEYVGFSFGRHCKILCPMEGHKHEVTLHCAADGRYVLLRDGKPVRPAVFEGMHYVPLRLGNNLEMRIACWNIDSFVVSQFVRIWRGEKEEKAADRIRYSVLIVTTRYARRLQAVLRSIAHQNGFDLSRIEVVVAYVPGLDPTEDLLDSIQLAYPDLHVVRCPFPRENANSKGFMINEAANMVRGEWVMLLDSDTLVSPEMFKRLDEVTNGEPVFFAPDGRKMLSRETTHKILLGEIAPWEQWDQLLRDAGEYRYREAKSVPIGFCQVVKTSCLREIPYTELDHFEGADMWFGMQMMEKYGKEARLSGLPVLHLDHGGSQWYGASKQF